VQREWNGGWPLAGGAGDGHRLAKIGKQGAPRPRNRTHPVKIVYDDTPKSTAINRLTTEWRARDDIRVLGAAAEIRAIRPAARAAKAEAQAQVKQVSRVCEVNGTCAQPPFLSPRRFSHCAARQAD